VKRRPLPPPESLRTLFRELLDGPASVGRRAVAPLPEISLVTARYCDDEGELVAACIADIELAVVAGAALGMVGPSVAGEALRRGEIRGPLLGHYYEVANVVSSLLNGPSVPHLRLVEVVNGVPDDVVELAARATQQQQYAVGIGPTSDLLLALVAV
jgi:hypothetical protein